MSYHVVGMPDILNPERIPIPTNARASSQGQIERVLSRTLGGLFDLSEEEKWWRDQYCTVLRRGYKFRKRFRPDWTPSWLGTDLAPACCEDAYPQVDARVMDAVSLKDGIRVCIKKVSKNKKLELRMSLLFSSPDYRQNPANHCVPILDLFDSSDPKFTLMVMPFLCKFDRPPFTFVDEVLDFVEQTLVGLSFLHENRIVHRDIGAANIMMDGEQIFPDGHHPMATYRNIAANAYAKILLRRDVASSNPVTYYFIDFEGTLQYRPEEKPLAGGRRALESDVPEYAFWRLFDPFPVDVYTLGMVYRKRLLDKYPNLVFLRPLISAMTSEEPKDRPTAAEALDAFNTVVKSQSWLARRSRLQEPGETSVQRVARDVITFTWEEVFRRFWNHRYVVVSSIVVFSRYLLLSPAEPATQIKSLIARSIAM